MKMRMIAVLALAAMMLCLFTACKEEKKPAASTSVSEEQAQEIVLADAGFTEEEVLDIHCHSIIYEDLPSYSIHINVEGAEYEYVVAIATGEILYRPDIM